MPLLSSSEEACSISFSEWIFFDSACGSRAPDQVDSDELSLGVEDGASVLLELFDVVDLVPRERCFPIPKGAPFTTYFMKLSKIKVAMNKHMPAG